MYIKRFPPSAILACSIVLLKAPLLIIFSNIVLHAPVRKLESSADPWIENIYGDIFLHILFTFRAVTLEEFYFQNISVGAYLSTTFMNHFIVWRVWCSLSTCTRSFRNNLLYSIMFLSEYPMNQFVTNLSQVILCGKEKFKGKLITCPFTTPTPILILFISLLAYLHLLEYWSCKSYSPDALLSSPSSRTQIIK